MIKFKGCFQKTFANYKVATLIGSLDKFFFKLPHLPKKIRLIINKIVPYLALVIGIIGLIVTVLSGAFLILSLLAFDTRTFLEIGGSFLLVLFNTLFLLKAFKPLRAGDAIGWIYLFWANILGAINSLINVINGESGIILTILGVPLGFYLLFEIGQFYVYKKDQS